MKKKLILINAKYPEEKRVSIIEEGVLVDFYAEVSAKEQLRGNIYKGVVKSVEPSLQAAFIDFGPAKHGFLQLREISPEYMGGGQKAEAPGGEDDGASGEEPRIRNKKIQNVLSKGQEIIVQVEKDERETKGANLTTYLSLPGRYIVMMPGREKVGISRKIEDKKERARMQEVFGTLKLPPKMGFILRTAGIDKTAQELSNDLKYLTKLWAGIKKKAAETHGPTLIYKEHDIAVRTVRDYLTSDVHEVLVDENETLKTVKNFLRQTLPFRKINIKLYKEKRPIFDVYKIEDQISKLGERFVNLPSRGYMVFDKTEALTAIDINSGRSRKEKNIEQTALSTNLEAADEIARQLRLRDIGGLVVIDFIDMESSKNRREVEARLKAALSHDKAHTDITGISRFGMLEMTRERMRMTYHESTYKKCPACSGKGAVKTDEMLALSVMRDIHAKASLEGTKGITCRLPVAIANMLANARRGELAALEKEYRITIEIVSDPAVQPGQYEINIEKEKPAPEPEKQAEQGGPAKPAAPQKNPKRPEKRSRKIVKKSSSGIIADLSELN